MSHGAAAGADYPLRGRRWGLGFWATGGTPIVGLPSVQPRRARCASVGPQGSSCMMHIRPRPSAPNVFTTEGPVTHVLGCIRTDTHGCLLSGSARAGDHTCLSAHNHHVDGLNLHRRLKTDVLRWPLPATLGPRVLARYCIARCSVNRKRKEYLYIDTWCLTRSYLLQIGRRAIHPLFSAAPFRHTPTFTQGAFRILHATPFMYSSF